MRESLREYCLRAGREDIPVSYTHLDVYKRQLSARLLWTLEELIGDGSVTSTQYETTEEDGVLCVTLTAECLENIAAVRILEDNTPESSQESG